MRRGSSPFRMVLFSALLVGFGALLGLSIGSFIQPRMEGMTMTGGPGGGMPGMTMPIRPISIPTISSTRLMPAWRRAGSEFFIRATRG